MLQIYIAAPINGMAFDEAQARNKAIAAMLRAAGYEPLDPLDFERADELQGLQGNLDAHATRLGLTSDERIVFGCLRLIDQADGILFDLRGIKAAGVQTWGTPCEMMYAWKQDLPRVAVLDDFHSAWINVLCPQRHLTFEAAIAALPQPSCII